MANYYSYFDNSTAGQNTRSEIDEESAIFGMGVSQDINCGITTVSTLKVSTGATIASNGNATLCILTASNATLGILTASSVICNTTTIPFYPPVVTTTQRDAMTVTAGAMVYNSSTNKLNFYNGSTWKVVSVD